MAEKTCRKCGIELFASSSIEAGYCSACAGMYEEARKAWEEKGFAKFCSTCGGMLHANESISAGICSLCRFKANKN